MKDSGSEDAVKRIKELEELKAIIKSMELLEAKKIACEDSFKKSRQVYRLAKIYKKKFLVVKHDGFITLMRI